MKPLRTLLLLLLLAPLAIGAARAQCPADPPSEGDFRSRTTGNWNSTATWDRYESGVWVDQGTDIDGTTPGATLTTERTTICNADVVTVNSPVTLGGPLVVDTTATLNVDAFDTFTAGGDVTNHGTVTGGTVSTFAFGGAAQTLSGDGVWTGTGLTLRADGTATLVSDVTVNANVATATGGTFNVDTFTMTVNGDAGTLKITNDGAFDGTGAVRTLGTVNIDLDGAGGGVFSAPFVVGGGTTTAIPSGRTAGPLTVEPGATLHVDAFDTFTIEGNLVNDGSISGGSASTLALGGAAQTLSGTGVWTTILLTMRIDAGASVSLAGNVSSGANLTIDAGGTLDPAGFTLTVTGDGETPKITNNGTVTGAGTIKTSGTVHIDLDGAGGGVFASAFEVADGTTTAIPSGTLAGPLTVDPGATFTVDAFDTFTAEGDVTNNGTINGGSASTFAFGGAAQNLSGTGAWTTSTLTARVDAGATVTLASNVSMGVDLTVQDGGTLSTGLFDLTYDGNTITPSLSNSGMVSGTGAFKTAGAVKLDPDGSGTGSFTAPLRILDSTATAVPSGTLAGPLTVDPGATFTVDAFDTFTAGGDVTNHGTISGGSASTFAFGGAAQTLSGGGVWQGSPLTTRIDSAAVVTLGSDVTYGASLTIVDGGTLVMGGFSMTYDGNTITPTLSNSGLVQGPSAFRTSGAVKLDPDGSGTGVFSAPLEVLDGAASGLTGTLAGPLTVDPGATFTVDAFDTFTAAGDVANDGTINGGSASTFAFGGAAQMLSGAGDWTGGPLTTRIDSAAVVTLGNDVTYAAALTTDADAELSLGAHTFTLSGVTLTHNGRLSGTGTLDYTGGTFVEGGVIAPGLSPGILTLDGDYDHSGAAFDIELDNSTTPGLGHDQVAVTGAVTLTGGTLDVSVTHDYFPNVGDQFTIVTCGGGCAGTFDAVNPPPGYGFQVLVNPNDVVLEVTQVPPVSIALSPQAEPVVIPPEGGTFVFDVFVINQSAVTQTVDAWIRISKGDIGKTLGPVSATLAPGDSLSHTVTQFVPGALPAGTYTVTGNVGAFPDTIDDSDGFTFEKEAAAGADRRRSVDNWERILTGDGALSVAEAVESPTTLTAGIAAEVPAEYGLDQNYPNPFNPQTVIRYALPEAGQVTLQVYNVLGQQVATLVNETREAGQHTVTFDASGLSAGVYLYRIQAGSFTATRQMTVLK
ncbi:T9SS type A sorting domain-containing protein [Rhodocaloribacter sp.]